MPELSQVVTVSATPMSTGSIFFTDASVSRWEALLIPASRNNKLYVNVDYTMVLDPVLHARPLAGYRYDQWDYNLERALDVLQDIHRVQSSSEWASINLQTTQQLYERLQDMQVKLDSVLQRFMRTELHDDE